MLITLHRPYPLAATVYMNLD